MTENFTKQINLFLSSLKTTFDQQGQSGKIIVAASFLFVLCCVCLPLISLFRSGNASNATPSPNIFPTQGTPQDTPTALFNFGGATFTPFPTLPVPTPFPTFTPAPTSTETPTQVVPTATETSISTATETATETLIPTNTNPPPTPTSSSPVVIITLDKADEYTEIQNVSNDAVDLEGWRLVSELGDQSCDLRGTLDPNEVLRIWSRRGSPGFDCRFSGNVWRDNADDPAVLYNPQGEEVSRFP